MGDGGISSGGVYPFSGLTGHPFETLACHWTAVISSSAFPPCHQALPPGRVPHVRGLSRTWVEHDLFPMLFPPVYTYLQEGKKEGLRPSFSTHVRESPRTWGTRPGGEACEQARDLSHNQRMTLTSAWVATVRKRSGGTCCFARPAADFNRS